VEPLPRPRHRHGPGHRHRALDPLRRAGVGPASLERGGGASGGW
jgi:hypothetical protein